MKYVFNSPLPEAASTDESDSLGQKLAQAGILDDDSAVVESISSEAADLTLEGQYRWGDQLSSMLATELDELADSALAELPVYRPAGDERFSNRGYYEIASADITPLHANDRSVWTYSLDLTYVGKRSSHFRAVEPEPAQIDHDWGTDLTAEIGAPASATKARWFNPETKEYERADPVGTCTGQNADIDRYDLTDASWYDPPPFDAGTPPVLIYDIAYPDDVRAGVRIYDTEGHNSKFVELDDGSDGPRQWQTVHTTEHDLDAPIVVSNGCLRLHLDEGAGTLTAEEWDDANSQWTTVTGLSESDQPSTVTLFDVDVTAIGMVRDQAQLTFDVDGSLFTVNATLATGADTVLVAIPENETGPVPTALEDWLSPIASTSLVDPGQTKTLVARSEVRR